MLSNLNEDGLSPHEVSLAVVGKAHHRCLLTEFKQRIEVISRLDRLSELKSCLMLVITNQLGLFFQDFSELSIASNLCLLDIQF